MRVYVSCSVHMFIMFLVRVYLHAYTVIVRGGMPLKFGLSKRSKGPLLLENLNEIPK
jgi:hypothetical protein